MMKPTLLIAAAPLALTACNMAGPFGGKTGNTSSGNSTAAVSATPDAVIVNGVTYYRQIGPSSATTPAPTATDSATIPASTPPTAAATDTPPPPPSDTNDGVKVTGGH